ncbi:MAG: DUF4091 domain-containing protein [Planctomycetes bacterium]|nr:DUF4091 domain-containing protein [Planctomycetota bacterium]
MPRSPHRVWLATTLARIYPDTRAQKTKALALEAARGERISFQVAVRNAGCDRVDVKLTLAASDAVTTRVRRVGYVPVAHRNTGTEASETDGAQRLPGFVPDPLFPEDTAALGAEETHAFWCNVAVPNDCAPGVQRIEATVTVGDQVIATVRVTARVHQLVLQPRRDFPVVQWFYADALCDAHGVQPFDEAFWAIVRPYMRNLVEHFQDTIYVPVFTPPLDGVKRPTQLLKVTRTAPDRYTFDWSDVQRWIDTARGEGITRFEWTHFFTQWGVKHAIRIYEGQGDGEKLLWPADTGATSDTYRAFLAQFLPELEAFLRRADLLERSYFHVSDEPHVDHVEHYRAARALLRELAPWMRTMDALSDIAFGKLGVVDLPIPSIHTTHEFIDAGIACGTYYCCHPRGAWLNRLMDTPLAKIRMNGWLFWRFQAVLFLHWGYNYWYRSQSRQLIDPFTVSDGQSWPHWAHGDTFCVYPGKDGPIDSIRWEVFAESLQDYALLQTVGVDPRGPLLRALASFADFPRSERWLAKARAVLLRTRPGGSAHRAPSTAKVRAKAKAKVSPRRKAR